MQIFIVYIEISKLALVFLHFWSYHVCLCPFPKMNAVMSFAYFMIVIAGDIYWCHVGCYLCSFGGRRWGLAGYCDIGKWWPTAGGDGALTNVDNVWTYNNNLIRHVNQGSPKKPGRPIETCIFAMFDKNRKTGDGIQKHWGHFAPNTQPIYQVNFN